MSERIRLVQGDTRPQLVASLQTKDGIAIDCTAATVRLYFRRQGTVNTLSTLNGVLLTGYKNIDGTINTSAPYTVAGSGGRVSFSWPVGALDVEAGLYEGEIEITFQDGTIQTVFDFLKFRVREDFL